MAQPDVSVDLVLHSRSEAARRAQQPGSLVQEAHRDGLDRAAWSQRAEALIEHVQNLL